MDPVESLSELGYSVIPLPAKIFENFNLEQFLNEQVEFIDSSQAHMKVLGGFGAFGNPTSYHHQEIRTLRNTIYDYMVAFFEHAHPNEFFMCIPDRFSERRPKTVISKDTFHIDVSVSGPDVVDAVVYGGWVNLDKDNTQYLSCVPSSHKEQVCNAAGFVKFSEEECKIYKGKVKKVEIPPQHCIVFHERLVHEVVGGVIKELSRRQYLKYMLSKTEFVSPFGDEIHNKLTTFGVPPYHVSFGKKGKEFSYPPMYSKNHISQEPKSERITNFSKNVKKEFTEVRTQPMSKGQVWVQYNMISLQEAGITAPFIPPYKKEELLWYEPRKLVTQTLFAGEETKEEMPEHETDTDEEPDTRVGLGKYSVLRPFVPTAGGRKRPRDVIDLTGDSD